MMTAYVDSSLISLRLDCITANLGGSTKSVKESNANIFLRTEAVVKQMSAMDKSLPEMATLRSSEKMVAATDGNLLEGARGLLAMGDALRLREAELSTFFSQLEELKEYSSVLNRATEDAGSLALGRLNVIQEKGLQVVQAIQTQTVRVNGLLDYYEAAIKRMSCYFVKWDSAISAAEKKIPVS